jgi:spore maturation protein CgeB
MTAGLDIAFFGSSLVSAYWNGAATYYRGIIKNLAARGHRVTFYEPDAFERQQHRDMQDPDWAKVVVYPANESSVAECLDAAGDADVLVKASGIGVFDGLLEHAILSAGRSDAIHIFWDVDAAATLDRVNEDPGDPFRSLIPQYDLVFTYGGGPPVIAAYEALGAQKCVPVYNALDPSTHHPVPPDPRFASTLAFLGNRLPDREARVHEFFFKPASLLPERQFLLGGNGWDANAVELPNVRKLGHIYTHEHNALNRTPLTVLNVCRESMARYGYSPATRVFEAAGAAACLVSDAWEGIELFLEPDREVLVAKTGEDVAEHLRRLDERTARAIGEAALKRVLAEHTYVQRADLVESILSDRPLPAVC